MNPRPAIAQTVDAVGSAYASIVFSSNRWLGWALLAVTFVRPVSGLAGLLAVLTASATAMALGYRSDAVRGGLYGFNALLIGLALSLGHGLDGRTAILCVLGGVGAVALTAFCGDMLHRGLGLPVLVLPFVVFVTALSSTLRRSSPSEMFSDFSIVGSDLPASGLTKVVLHAFGSIFYQPSLVAGVGVLLVCLIASRIMTVAAVMGILVAVGLGEVVRPGLDHATLLPATYNAALTAIAVGTFFFVPSRSSIVAASASAALAAWLSIALAPVFGIAQLPVLAWPFVVVTFVAVRALRLRSPDQAPFASPLMGQSPEANVEHVATFEKRFGIPGPPQFYLPVLGSWRISQGTEGEHTHKGAWAGALDFEIVDENNFPFRGEGLEATDYFCFGAPVFSPGTGTVAAVHDGQPDGKPGDIETGKPWGNAVIIQHGPELFSVLAHLKCGSIKVKPGEYVVASQPVAECGSSGRSPRPHLHLQAQRTTELGAPAIPFRLLHYTTQESRESHTYEYFGVPSENDSVASVTPNPVMDAFIAMVPGTTLQFDIESGARLRLRSEIGLTGERSLVDVESGDRLYFHLSFGTLSFTTYVGRSDGPLRALFIALPRLVSVTGARVRYVDAPPSKLLLSAPLRWLHELVRVVWDPVLTRATVEAETTADGLIVRSSVGFGLSKNPMPRYRSVAELDALGLARIEVTDLKRPGQALLKAKRVAS